MAASPAAAPPCAAGPRGEEGAQGPGRTQTGAAPCACHPAVSLSVVCAQRALEAGGLGQDVPVFLGKYEGAPMAGKGRGETVRCSGRPTFLLTGALGRAESCGTVRPGRVGRELPLSGAEGALLPTSSRARGSHGPTEQARPCSAPSRRALPAARRCPHGARRAPGRRLPERTVALGGPGAEGRHRVARSFGPRARLRILLQLPRARPNNGALAFWAAPRAEERPVTADDAAVPRRAPRKLGLPWPPFRGCTCVLHSETCVSHGPRGAGREEESSGLAASWPGRPRPPPRCSPSDG